jgi:hypothetical protein
MQNSSAPRVISFGGLLCIGGLAFAQQPPDVVVSDDFRNTAMGSYALSVLTPGADSTEYLGTSNTAVGWAALNANSIGYQNSALGFQSLSSNQSGNDNVALGVDALYSNSTGSYNTATGFSALSNNTTGSNNSASGNGAMNDNTTGSANAAFGANSMFSNSTGSYNSALGVSALNFNKTGSNNTAVGYYASLSNTTGSDNTATGNNALYSNTAGNTNVALGEDALYTNTTGSHNIGIGFKAGYALTTGSNDIDIGSDGRDGESGVIRIGVEGTQKQAYLAGVATSQITGAAVYVNAHGQLGVLASSERYKTAVAPMGASTAALAQLRPVTFHLKSEPQGEVQYGLIAEEVAAVYPELVIRDAAGQIQGVRYDELAPMLLNEVQQQRHELQEIREEFAALRRSNEATQAALSQLQATDRVAMR